MDKLFGFDKISAHDENVELLTTLHDDVECAIVCGILKEENIPFMVKDRGSGEIVRILGGFSMFGKDLFVPKELIDQAKNLLDVYRNGDVCEDTELLAGEEEEI